MAKYRVEVDKSGYVRTCEVWEVEATSEKEALENYSSGNRVEYDTIRDDRSTDNKSAAKINPDEYNCGVCGCELNKSQVRDGSEFGFDEICKDCLKLMEGV